MSRTEARTWPRSGRASWAFFAVPGVAVVGADVLLRARHLATFGVSSLAAYAVTAIEAALVWGSLLVLASSTRGPIRHLAAAVFVLLATLAFGSQRYFHQQYGTYLNTDAVLFGLSFRENLASQMRADLRAIAHAHVAPLLAAVAIVALARACVRPSDVVVRWSHRLVLPVLAAAVVVPWSDRAVQAATPDVLYLHAIGGAAEVELGLAEHHVQTLPGERSPEYLPAMHAVPVAPRNVLFVLTESVRADASCSAFDPRCEITPRTNAAAPSRLPLLQMRANDSTTAVSVAVLFTGLSPTSSRDELHRAPMLWEYARAAGWDTAYFTSQDLRFGNSDMFVRDAGARLHVSGAELSADANLDTGAPDELVTAHALRELPRLREPFVAVVHYANTHFPYVVDEDRAPFRPSEFTKDPEKNLDFWNHYRNAVHLQDETIGALIEGVRASAFGPRTVIVFTSDHGEAFREHWQTGHTLSVYDEEIHVPAWIDAPEGTISPSERNAIAKLRETPVFHVDVLPTLLDLVGLWDAPEIARFRERLTGASLLRDGYVTRPVALTNCAALWDCPFKNWGMMLGAKKLESRAWDAGWHCFDVLADPKEQHDLGEEACGDLPRHASAIFGGLPREATAPAVR